MVALETEFGAERDPVWAPYIHRSTWRENQGCCFGLDCGIMVWWAWLAITAITFLVLLVWSPRALSPKRLVVKLLDGYRRVNAFRQWLRGTTATEEVERRVISGQAWADFCDTLKAAGAAINAAGTPTDAYTQAEGYRCVLKGWIVVCAARCTADRRSGGGPGTCLALFVAVWSSSWRTLTRRRLGS